MLGFDGRCDEGYWCLIGILECTCVSDGKCRRLMKNNKGLMNNTEVCWCLIESNGG